MADAGNRWIETQNGWVRTNSLVGVFYEPIQTLPSEANKWRVAVQLAAFDGATTVGVYPARSVARSVALQLLDTINGEPTTARVIYVDKNVGMQECEAAERDRGQA